MLYQGRLVDIEERGELLLAFVLSMHCMEDDRKLFFDQSIGAQHTVCDDGVPTRL